MGQTPLYIHLNKQAGLAEMVPDFLWHHDQGPLENIFTWLNRFIVVFSGGTFGLLMMALTAAGYSLGDLGKELDDVFGLRTIGDLHKLDPSSLTEKASSLIMSKVGGTLGVGGSTALANGLVSLSYAKFAADPDPVEFGPGNWFAPPGKSRVDTPSEPESDVDGSEITPYQKKMIEERQRNRSDRLTELQKRRDERADAIQRKKTEQEQVLERRRSERLEEINREKEELERSNLTDSAKQDHQVKILNLKRQQEIEDRKYREQQSGLERERQGLLEQKHKDESATERERLKNEHLEERKYDEKAMAKRMKAQEGLARMRLPGGRGFFSGAGKAAIGIGLTGLIGYVFKSITDPSSWLARLLRGAGLYEAEHFAHPSAPGGQRERQETGKAPSAPGNYDSNLEKAFDDVLGR